MEKLVSLIIPIYNEEDSVEILVNEILSLEKEFSFLLPIFVNNGSTDNTRKKLEALNNSQTFKLLNLEHNRGYGGGILEGLKSSNTEIIGWTHADLQITKNSIINSLEKIKQLNEDGCNNFFLKGIRHGRKISERIISYLMSLVASLIHFENFKDINGQPTFFTRNLINNFNNPNIPKDFNIDFYFYFTAVKNRSLIVRTETQFIKRKFGVSKWNVNIISKINFMANTFRYIIKINKKI